MCIPAIEVKKVSKIIDQTEVIKNISFSVAPGEVFGFLGPNGAGKTTTIKMMVGLMKMTQGDIYIHGKSITTDFKVAIKHVGAIVENPSMYNFLSGWKNLIIYARMSRNVSIDQIKKIVKLVDLEKVIHKKVKTYSLGMRQRLGLAQALLHEPSVLILDEPTNGLDPAGIHDLRQYIKALSKEKQIAILVSSHLLSEVEQMCDRVGIIKNGELLSIDTVENITENTSLKIMAKPLNKALNLLKEKKQFIKEVNGNEIIIEINPDDVPSLINELIKEGIDIYNVQNSSVSLEEKYLEVTGGAS